ncbi:MAG: polysaccharide deacetylase family protein [Acidobacteriota bacterium]
MTVRKQIRRLQPLVPQGAEGVTILGYHLVGAGTTARVDLPSTTFVAQMQELADFAEVISLQDAVQWLLGVSDTAPATAEPRPRVVLTFDDAYANFAENVFPVLQDFEFPAVLYVPTEFVAGTSAGPLTGAEQLPACSWEQLAELVGSGLVAIGSHTCSHCDLRSLSEEAAEDELLRSRATLEERLGISVDSFCYPRAQWNARTELLVQRHYSTAVVAGGGKAYPHGWRPHRLPRVPVRSDAPTSLSQVLRQRLWLEEWVADRWRRHAS